MDLQVLSGQYWQEGKKIRERLSQQREQLKGLYGKEAERLERTINDLYLMCLDCEKTARYLQNYYDDTNDTGGKIYESIIA